MNNQIVNEGKSFEKRMPAGKLHTQGKSYWVFSLTPIKYVDGCPVFVAVPMESIGYISHLGIELHSYARYVQTNSYALEYINNNGFYLYTWKVTNGLEAQGLVQ